MDTAVNKQRIEDLWDYIVHVPPTGKCNISPFVSNMLDRAERNKKANGVQRTKKQV